MTDYLSRLLHSDVFIDVDLNLKVLRKCKKNMTKLG